MPPSGGSCLFTGLAYSRVFSVSHTFFPVVLFIGLQCSVLVTCSQLNLTLLLIEFGSLSRVKNLFGNVNFNSNLEKILLDSSMGISFIQSGRASRWRVCYQWGQPHLVFWIFCYFIYFHQDKPFNQNVLTLFMNDMSIQKNGTLILI